MGYIMTTLKIDPTKKSVTIFDNDNNVIDMDFIKNLKDNAIEVEKGLKIASFLLDNEEENYFFYYVVQNGKKGEIYTFKGIGIVFGDKIEEKIEKIKEKIVW